MTSISTLSLSAAVPLPSDVSSQLTFWHKFDFESGWDGAVLEYSVDDGAHWVDILAGKGGDIPANNQRFMAGGYNDTLRTSSSNPLSGR